MLKTELDPLMKRPIELTDLNETIYSDLYIPYAGFSDNGGDGESYPRESYKADSQIAALSVPEFMSVYKVDEDVAKRLYSYQNDVLARLHDSMESVVSRVDRYHAIQPFMDSNRFNKQLFQVYVDNNSSRSELLKENNPYRFLRLRLIGIATSLVLLVAAALIYINFHDELGLDRTGCIIIAAIWAAITLMITLATPKEYATRKVIYNVESSLK